MLKHGSLVSTRRCAAEPLSWGINWLRLVSLIERVGGAFIGLPVLACAVLRVAGGVECSYHIRYHGVDGWGDGLDF